MSEDLTQTTGETAGTAAASQGSTETTQTSAPTTNTDTQEQGTDGQTSQPVQPAYTPNFKYKAFQKEKELDAFWHPLVKDPESEKKVKDVFTRADAFDDLKSRFEGTQTEFSKVYNEYQALDQDVRKVTSFLNRGDLDNFFSSVGLDQQKIMDWVSQKLDQENLPPDQKRAMQMQAQERQRMYDLEMEKTTLEQQYQTQAVQARSVQLDMTLSRPDVSQVASAWDQRAGEIGAFRNLVIEEAQKAWFTQGQDLSAEQATQVVMAKYGKFIDSGVSSPQAMTPQAAPGQYQSQQATSKPVIPTVQGRGTSPVKKSPKSLDDLRQMAKELNG